MLAQFQRPLRHTFGGWHALTPDLAVRLVRLCHHFHSRRPTPVRKILVERASARERWAATDWPPGRGDPAAKERRRPVLSQMGEAWLMARNQPSGGCRQARTGVGWSHGGTDLSAATR